MKIVIFGLTVSSSWGNGHATLWRGLLRALGRRGHHAVFYERDVPYYAEHRDLHELSPGRLRLYGSWEAIRREAERALEGADAAVVTSYCPDGVAASRLVLDADVPVRCFYDLDTPVTLARMRRGDPVPYLPPEGLGGFDLVLSYTGGRALDALRTRLGAPHVAPLYGSVDPDVHRPAPADPRYRADLSYLGTWSADRQDALEELLLAPARAAPGRAFVVGGAQYPEGLAWPPNVRHLSHVPPAQHPAFFSSAPLTLSVTRGPMAEMGWCPSGRLFEAAACGTPVLTDAWEGLEAFFTPGEEILVARTRDDTLAALGLGPAALQRLGTRARERVLAEHTADHRAAELVARLDAARGRPRDVLVGGG